MVEVGYFRKMNDEPLDFFAISDSAKMKLDKDTDVENNALGNQTCKVNALFIAAIERRVGVCI